MIDHPATVANVIASASHTRFRVLKIEGQDTEDLSWERVTCHLHREDVSSAAVPLIYTLGALSFQDARPRALSEIEYEKNDEWTFADVLLHLRLEDGRVVFDTDYVRGRMMKTRIAIGSDGTFVIETRARCGMVRRWFSVLRGQQPIRLVAANGHAVD